MFIFFAFLDSYRILRRKGRNMAWLLLPLFFLLGAVRGMGSVHKIDRMAVAAVADGASRFFQRMGRRGA